MVRQVLLLLEVVMPAVVTARVVMVKRVMVSGFRQVRQMLRVLLLDRLLLAVAEAVFLAAGLRIGQSWRQELAAASGRVGADQRALRFFAAILLGLLAIVVVLRGGIFFDFDLLVPHHHLVGSPKAGNQTVRLFLSDGKIGGKLETLFIERCRFTHRIVRANLFHATFEPRSDGLLRHFFFDDVLELLSRQQLFQLQRLSDVDRAIRQHAVDRQ